MAGASEAKKQRIKIDNEGDKENQIFSYLEKYLK